MCGHRTPVCYPEGGSSSYQTTTRSTLILHGNGLRSSNSLWGEKRRKKKIPEELRDSLVLVRLGWGWGGGLLREESRSAATFGLRLPVGRGCEFVLGESVWEF